MTVCYWETCTFDSTDRYWPEPVIPLATGLVRSHFASRAGRAQLIQVVRRCLHHRAALRQILCVVVDPARAIRVGVRELSFDDLGSPPEFAQKGRRASPKSMRGDFAAAESHARQGDVECIARDGLRRIPLRGEEVFAIPGDFAQALQQLQSLAR